MNINEILAAEFKLKQWQIDNTVQLIDDANTIPFIARYRKEATGSLDDQLLRQIYERLQYLRSLQEQKEKVSASIEEQGAMTEEIANALLNAKTLTEIEDIYRPYRPKRKTRASVAKAKGLEPLALKIYEQKSGFDPLEYAADFINDEVPDCDAAIAGAKDIIAEMISDDPTGRKQLRYVCRAHGDIVSKGAKDDLGVYEAYGDYREPVAKIANHRILAVNRGEKEGFLKVSLDVDKSSGLGVLTGLYVKNDSACADLVRDAADDAYTRLVFPSIEREIRNELTDRACEDSIKVFSKNTAQLLM